MMTDHQLDNFRLLGIDDAYLADVSLLSGDREEFSVVRWLRMRLNLVQRRLINLVDTHLPAVYVDRQNLARELVALDTALTAVGGAPKQLMPEKIAAFVQAHHEVEIEPAAGIQNTSMGPVEELAREALGDFAALSSSARGKLLSLVLDPASSVQAHLDVLTDEQRLQLLKMYCRGCGYKGACRCSEAW